MTFALKFLTLLVSFGLIGYASVFAAGIDHFQVTLEPQDAKVGEALDLTIEAVDKNNETVTDYIGTILIFSETDPEAELPSALQDNSYIFEAADQWKIKFENSVKFKSAGTHDIHIYDLDDDTVMGIAEASITQEEIITNIEISIISPEHGLTIGDNKVTISGTTRKNHKVNILLNDEVVEETTSDNSGMFEKTIYDLKSGDHTFQAHVLNADEEIAGESEEVDIKIDSQLPSLKSIKVTPSEVDPESNYEVEVIANLGLSSVETIVNDNITTLQEVGEGIYRAEISAPQKPGTYKIDVVLRNEFGHEKKELGSESITVNEVPLNAPEEPVKETTPEEPVEETVPEVTSNQEEKDLTIKNIKVTQLKSKSIITWDEVDDIEGYNVYKRLNNNTIELISTVEEPRFEIDFTGEEIKYEYFAIKAIAKTSSGEIYEGDLSEATKVQTGPEILILLLLSLFIGWFFLVSKQKRA